MRFKVGDQWFQLEPGRPIMVELTEEDKRNIANMDPKATKYAVFHDDERATKEEKLAWMQ